MTLMTMNSLAEHGNIGKSLPKEEMDDGEITAMAEKIKRANDQVIANIKTITAVQNIRLVTSAEKQDQPSSENLPSDWTSVQGQFGWTAFDKDFIPHIFRNGQKYIAERMVHTKLVAKYSLVFHKDVLCHSVNKFPLTPAEIKLLNEINSTHCDKAYGTDEFTNKENVILLEDVTEIHKFLKFCFDVLIHKNQSTNRQCGFIQIKEGDASHRVPYVLFKSKHYVPLFYFDGNSVKMLEEKAVQISGWPLTYLKLACKVQDIGAKHYDKTQLEVVELELVKKFFYIGTVFEECWPTDIPVDHLIDSQYNEMLKSYKQQKSSGRSLTTSKPTVSMNSSNITANTVTTPVNNSNRPLQSIAAQTPRNMNTNNTNYNVPSNFQTQNQNHPFYSNSSSNYPVPTYSTPHPYYNNHNPYTVRSTPQNQNRPPPPYPNSSTGTNQNGAATYCNTSSTSSASLPNRSLLRSNNTSDISQNGNCQQQYNANTFTGIHPPLSLNVVMLPDQPCYYGNTAYSLKNMKVGDKIMYTCINMNPNDHSVVLVTVEEIVSVFGIELDHVLTAIRNFKIEVYIPNKKMKDVLKQRKINFYNGLIRLDDLVKILPQIRYVSRRS